MKNKFCLLLLAAVLGASPVRASEWEYGFSGSVSGLYGYSDVAERFSAYNSHNHGVGDAELGAYAKYIFDDEIEAGVVKIKSLKTGEESVKNICDLA